MLMASRELSLHPAVLIALFGQMRNPPESLAQLDRHLLRDIGVDPSQLGAPSPLKPVPAESALPPRSGGSRSRSTIG